MTKRSKKSKIEDKQPKKFSFGLFVIRAIQSILLICACVFLAMIAQEEWQRGFSQRKVDRIVEIMNTTPVPTKIYNTTPEKTILITPEPTPSPVPTPSPTQSPEPTPTPRPIKSIYSELYKQNPDLVGWIEIEDTVINYPVTQHRYDNEYYLHRDFLGNDSAWGTIYVDSSSDYEPLGNHIIIYGHRMNDGSMFKSLLSYDKKSYYKSHDTIIFNTIHDDLEWEIFSMSLGLWDDVAIYDDSFETPADWLAFTQNLQDISIHDTSHIELSEDDVVITLITCTYEFEDARFFVHARLKKDTD